MAQGVSASGVEAGGLAWASLIRGGPSAPITSSSSCGGIEPSVSEFGDLRRRVCWASYMSCIDASTESREVHVMHAVMKEGETRDSRDRPTKQSSA